MAREGQATLLRLPWGFESLRGHRKEHMHYLIEIDVFVNDEIAMGDEFALVLDIIQEAIATIDLDGVRVSIVED